MMLDPVIRYELRRVVLDLAAALHLAREEIPNQDHHAQLLPARRLVPFAPTNVRVTVA